MRKILLLFIVFGILATNAIAQEKIDSAVYKSNQLHKKNQTLPDFNITRLDRTLFNTRDIPKGRKLMVIIFSPDCEHCKNFTKRILTGIDSLKSIDFYFVTPVHDTNALRRYYTDFNMGGYKNIKIVGRDAEFFLTDFYMAKHFPWPMLYDEHKKLIKIFDSETYTGDIYKYIK